jgi:HSP20 family protein
MRPSDLRLDALARDAEAMTENFDRMFGARPAVGGPRGFLPSTDVFETENEVVIELDVPGVHPENLSAEVIDGQLVVTGERAPSEGAVRRYRSERWQGRFVRTFSVPRGVDGGAIKAQYDHGVLRLTLPKAEDAKPRRIAIGHGAVEPASS